MGVPKHVPQTLPSPTRVQEAVISAVLNVPHVLVLSALVHLAHQQQLTTMVLV